MTVCRGERVFERKRDLKDPELRMLRNICTEKKGRKERWGRQGGKKMRTTKKANTSDPEAIFSTKKENNNKNTQ
jgi:hypothetical protein